MIHLRDVHSMVWEIQSILLTCVLILVYDADMSIFRQNKDFFYISQGLLTEYAQIVLVLD